MRAGVTVQEELADVLGAVKGYRWTAELFGRCQLLLTQVNLFSILRRELLPPEYKQFDLMYCSYVRPHDDALNRWLMKSQRKEGDEKVKSERKEVKKKSAGIRGQKYKFRGFPENW